MGYADDRVIEEGAASKFQVMLELPPDLGDATQPDASTPVTVRPARLLITAFFERGRWAPSACMVIGPKIHPTTGRPTKRDYEVVYSDPYDEYSGAPQWVIDRVRAWMGKLNA